MNLGPIELGPVPPSVEALDASVIPEPLAEIGETAQITVFAEMSDGSSRDVTSSIEGTTFTASNPVIISVDTAGLVTANGSGTGIVSILNDGVFASVQILVDIGDDRDGDGLPNDYEEANGLDPDDPSDAGADPDGDGLTNLDEFNAGTDPNQADTDGDGLNDADELALGTNPFVADTDIDGILDGEEVVFGSDGRITDPLNPDTDGDGIPDGTEVRCGLNPNDPTTFGVTPDGQFDSDGDSLINEDELAIFTDPCNPDTDGDGLLDGEEVLGGTDPRVPDMELPMITITSPVDGDTFAEGETIHVMAVANDDGRVTRVDFETNTGAMFTDFLAPYEFDFVAPVDVGQVTFSATAEDTNANVGTATPVVINVIKDCNRNDIPDADEIAAGAPDCNGNGRPDECDVAPPVASAADNCGDAQPVCPGIAITGTTIGTTNDGSASCAASAGSAEVWYRYTPEADGSLLVELCGSTYDTALSVHTGCPGTTANQVACNDDSCGLQSRVTLGVTAGATYLIRIAGFAGSTGDFTMLLTGPDCQATSADCNGNLVPDECEPDEDCNGNDALDICDLADGTSFDCDGNMRPDECDVLDPGRDGNANGFLDGCETEAIGTVVDTQGLAVDGATLTTNGDVGGISLADGSFSIAGVPTFLGDIVVTASAEVSGQPLVGISAAVMPVPSGVTDVGVIALASCAFESNVGTGLNQSDDDSDFVAFTGGFTFPYFGTVQTGIFINSNGNLTFGSGNTTFNPQPIPGFVVSGLARISPAFVDFNPAVAGDVFFNQFSDRFVITWLNVPLFGAGGDNTLQAILHSDGRIQFIYNGLTANGTLFGVSSDPLDISVAITPGGTPSVLTVDYSIDSPLSSGGAQAVFENFNFANLFDLDFTCVLWQPNGGGGFDVQVTPLAPCVPVGLVSGVVVDSDGSPIPECPLTVTSSGDPNFSGVTQTSADGRFMVTEIPMPGGINVNALDGTNVIGTASGLLWNEDETLDLVVKPVPAAAKE